MKTLEELRARLDEVAKAMTELNDSAVEENGKLRSLSKDESEKFSALEKEARELRDTIRRRESAEDAKRDADRLNQVVSKAPRIEVIREEDCNDDGEYRGYKAGNKGGFGEFMIDVARAAQGQGESKRLRALQDSVQKRAATGANETVLGEGGFLTQSDHADLLFTNVKDAGTIASRCREIPMSNLYTTFNMVDETSLAIGSQFGGVKAYWRAEAGSFSSKKPKFKEVKVKAEAMDGLFYATEEQLADGPQLESFASLAFVTCMSYQLDDSIIAGDGAGKPLGIIKSPCRIAVAKEDSQTADTVVFNNIDKMVDRLMLGSESNAIWLIHPNVKRQLRNLTIIGSHTDFMPFMPAGGISGKPYDQLLGYPVVRSQVCRDLGDEGDVILADFSQYFLFRRQGISASQSVHVAFLTGERVFKWTLRANGMPIYSSAITDANGSTTRSPFVTLAARA